MLEIGCSSACLYPMETEDAVRTLLDGGVRLLEIFLNAECELELPFASALRERTDAAGARIVSMHPYFSAFEPMQFFSQYDRRFEDGLRFYRRFFAACGVLGAKVFVFHGDWKDWRFCDLDGYCERFSRLADAAAEYGVVFAQENVAPYRSRDPAFIRGMRARLPNARFVLDCKQAIRAGFSVGEMAEAMAGALVHVHLSDCDGARDCLLPGGGEVDFAEIARLCRGAETSVLEVYRGDYGNTDELFAAYRYLRRQMMTDKKG